MTLQEFSRDVVPIIQLIVTTAGLASLFLLWWQVRQTTMWNKLNSPASYANTSLLLQLEHSLVNSLNAIRIDVRSLTRELTSPEVEAIINDDNAYFAAKSYLTDLENLGAAVSIGAIDHDLAYAVHSSRLLRSYSIFSTFITRLREKFGDHEIYIEMEKTALKWKTISLERKQRQLQLLQHLKNQVTAAGGAQPKV
jgi:hypothetical protein